MDAFWPLIDAVPLAVGHALNLQFHTVINCFAIMMITVAVLDLLEGPEDVALEDPSGGAGVRYKGEEGHCIRNA